MPDAYIIALLPLALTVLVWHEAGHFIAAKLAGVTVTAFVIGVGPGLLRFHTGNLAVAVTPDTRDLNPERPRPKAGQHAVCFLQRKPDGAATAVAIAHPADVKKPPPELRENLRELYRTATPVPGRIRAVEPGRIRLAPMTWELRAIPVAAFVAMPHDPMQRDPRCYNTAGYATRFGILAAGVLANFLLFVTAASAAAWFPAAAPVRISDINPAAPAYAAGLRAEDLVISANLVPIPDREQLANIIVQAYRERETVSVKALRERERHIRAEFVPQRPDGAMRLVMSGGGSPQLSIANAPQLAYNQVTRIIGNVLELARPGPGAEPSEITGPVRTATDVAQITRRGGIRAWLLIMGAVSLSTGVLNFLPIPPLDGGRAALLAVEMFRRGRQLSPAWETGLAAAGILAISATAGFMILRDIIQIAG